MNPNKTIRPWILACGAQYGIREAHEYRWPDFHTRQVEMFCTYQFLDGEPTQKGQEDMSEAIAGGHDITRRGAQQHRQRVQVDLINSEDGLYELQSFGVAAHISPDIRNIFKTNGCAFHEVLGVTNLTTFDDDPDIRYHHRMICTFDEYVEISLIEINAVVDTILTNIETINHTG